MIVVDTSALIAVLASERLGPSCATVLAAATRVVMSAVTLAETQIVALGKNVAKLVDDLLAQFQIEIIPVDAAVATRVGDAYALWGKGRHPAGLNFGYCFANVAAKDAACPLLFIGHDFGQTDLTSARQD